MSMSLSFLRFSCSSHSISPSLSHLPPQLPNSRASHFVFCRYRRTHIACSSSSIHRRLCKLRSFSSLSGASEFDRISQRSHDEEEDDEQQIRTRASNEDEVDDDEEDEQEFISSYVFPERWDVLGLGQAMVDFSGTVDDDFLENLGLEKGTRRLVNHEERGRVLQAMDGCSYKAAAGGSLSNTLVALARLGGRSLRELAINVAMAGSVASDLLGGFYREKLRRANVQFLSVPIKDATIGTVIVLTTPDAHRTMLAYQGTSSTVNFDTSLASAVSKTNILVVEGYLFELPDTIRTITKACMVARSNGALVAVTASDVSCIERHFDHFRGDHRRTTRNYQ